MNYLVLFDFRSNWGWHWLFSLLIVAFLVYGAPAAMLRIKYPDKYPIEDRIRYVGFAAVALLTFTVFIGSQVYDQVHERLAFAKGAYNVVEGRVRNYTGKSGDKIVWFDVGKVHFQVMCCYASMRFHQTPYESGYEIIRNGEWLRITYLSPDEILRIEKRD